MKIMPMGDYYVWHCDWCDSTNYTLWTRMERAGVACAACHHQISEFSDGSIEVEWQKMTASRFNNVTL